MIYCLVISKGLKYSPCCLYCLLLLYVLCCCITLNNFKVELSSFSVCQIIPEPLYFQHAIHLKQYCLFLENFLVFCPFPFRSYCSLTEGQGDLLLPIFIIYLMTWKEMKEVTFLFKNVPFIKWLCQEISSFRQYLDKSIWFP